MARELHADVVVVGFGAAGACAALEAAGRMPVFPEVSEALALLRESGLPAEQLVVGVPEQALFDHRGDPVDALEIFAEMGLRLAVHDFGRDHREVARLRGLPL